MSKRAVWKYPMGNWETGMFSTEMPFGAEVLSLDWQHGHLCVQRRGSGHIPSRDLRLHWTGYRANGRRIVFGCCQLDFSDRNGQLRSNAYKHS